VLHVTNHSNAVNIAHDQANKLMENIKAKAATTRGTPDQFISSTTLSITVDVRAALGDTEVLKHTLDCQEVKHYPKNSPKSISPQKQLQ